MLKRIFSGFVAVCIGLSFAPLEAHAQKYAAISAPVGEHIRNVMLFIELDARNCSTYSFGSGVGCMTSAGDEDVNIIRLGIGSPCRKHGTVQLDFTDDFYLIGVTCGSSKDLLRNLVSVMNASYGEGEETRSKDGDYRETLWKTREMAVKAVEENFGDRSVYSASVFLLR